jgi:hypothetical protein
LESTEQAGQHAYEQQKINNTVYNTVGENARGEFLHFVVLVREEPHQVFQPTNVPDLHPHPRCVTASERRSSRDAEGAHARYLASRMRSRIAEC